MWLSLRSARQGLSIEGEAEGMEDTGATSSGGFENRADIGVEVGAPSGSEAVGDLAEDEAGPQRLFGAVVGGRDGAVGEEDEQALAEALDDALQLQARFVVRLELEELVEGSLEPGVGGGQGGVGERRTTVADAYGALQQMLQAGGEGGVAGIHRVLDVAQQMGEADLMVPAGPAPLSAETVGDPDCRADLAEELAYHRLAARRADDEAGAVGVVEHPGPEGLLADAHAGLIGGQHGAGQQPLLDPAGLRREGWRAVLQQVGQRALADLQPEQITQQPRQTPE